ncbi:MAG: toxin-antitoxin system TumE family protein [Candidatus Brocadiales bacterium]
MFRYDTTPHFPHLSTFPDHKHIQKGNVIPSKPLDLKDILGEVATFLKPSS